MSEEYSSVKANELSIASSLDNSKSFIMVDRETNEGIIVNSNTVADFLASRFLSSSMESDSLKFYVID